MDLDDASVSIDWHAENDDSVFTVADVNGKVVLRYRGGPPFGPPLSEDPTPGIDEEDWDLGLFIVNVMSDEERRELVRRGSS